MNKIYKILIVVSIIFQTTFLFSIESSIYDSATEVEKMCIDIQGSVSSRCPKEQFNKLNQNGHSKIFTNIPSRCTNCEAGTLHFSILDPYSNDEKKYYKITAILIQRIGENSGLFKAFRGILDDNPEIVFLENLPKQKYEKDEVYEGLVLGGSGYYEYNTVGGMKKTVLRGNAIAIWKYNPFNVPFR